MNKHLLRNPFYLLLFFFFFFTACEKEEEPTPEERRASDASYNDGITPGVRNVFFEEKLSPNATSQLVFKIAYNEDTLAAYGKINGSGQLEYIHTTVLAKKSSNELLVTETFPSTSSSRMYAMIDNVKSNMVIEIQHYSSTKSVVSIVDMNWDTGNRNVLKSTYVNDGVISGEYSGLRLAGGLQPANDRVWNCDQPQPSDDLDQIVDNHLDYHACGGSVWDTHPSLNVIKEAITSSIEALNNSGKYADKASELEFLKSTYAEMNSLYSSIKGKISSYKFEMTPLGGLLKQLEEKINKLMKSQYDIRLVLFEEATDTDYDEVTDNEIKITFTVIELATGLPFTKEPVYVDMAFIIPGTNDALNMQTKASSKVNGLVTFKFDPTTIDGYEKYTSLEARWGLASDNWKKTLSRNVSLKFIKPKVVFKNGSTLASPIKFGNNQAQFFKLVNEDDRTIPVDYSNVTISNVTNSKVGYTMLKGTDDFSLQLYTYETTLQNTSMDVFYKSKKIQTINASIMDSLEIYRAAAVGPWTVSNAESTNPPYDLELYADGTGKYVGQNGVPYSNGGYPITWSIKKHSGRFYLYESGFFHPGYNQYRVLGSNKPNEYLGYPISIMKTYNDYGSGPVEALTYRKN